LAKAKAKRKYTCKICGQKMNGPSSHKEKHRKTKAPSSEVTDDVANLVIEGLEAIKGQVKAQKKKEEQLRKILERALAVLDG
jgi:hypothetical protein